MRTFVPLTDQIDGPGFVKKPQPHQRASPSPRIIFYLHLCALVPSIIFGQCERWGYGHVLETGIWGIFFGPAALLISLSLFVFPVAVAMRLMFGSPSERWSWIAFPLSLMISYLQFLAILPLFQ
jgi:hypothetical protein